MEDETHTSLNDASAPEKGEFYGSIRLEAKDDDRGHAKRANG